MYWENIQGWFTFQQLYSNMINKFPSESIFVEIGTFKAKSAVYMAEKIMEKNKSIDFYTIDLFKKEDNDHASFIDVDDLYKEAVKNIEPIKDLIHIIKGSSHEVHDQFENDSISFIFIDGGHTYECVKKDIQLWFPKVKQGGVISGHDYSSPDVRRAVNESLLSATPYFGDCWYLEK